MLDDVRQLLVFFIAYAFRLFSQLESEQYISSKFPLLIHWYLFSLHLVFQLQSKSLEKRVGVTFNRSFDLSLLQCKVFDLSMVAKRPIQPTLVSPAHRRGALAHESGQNIKKLVLPLENSTSYHVKLLKDFTSVS